MQRPTTPSTYRRRLALVAAGAVLALAACAPGDALGTLRVVVVGLPAATAADVAVAATAVTTTTSLTLAAGPHAVTAAPVLATASIMGDRYAPDQTQIETTVAAGGTTTVTITYSLAQTALLLAPNTGDGTMTVLTSDDLAVGGTASSAWSTEVTGNAFTGMALGPDGRLYVSDYFNDAIVVIDAADLTADGAVAPAAVITNAGLDGPTGGGFDSDGNLWVGSYDDDVLLRFDGVLGATGDVDLPPALVVSVNDSTYATTFGEIYDVFVDHLDHVWIADRATDAIHRFDGLAGVTGALAVVPDLFLRSAISTISGSGSTLARPISVVVDVDGTLYVGNEDAEVARFDDALALSGDQGLEASAYLDTGIVFEYMVALDQSGALWIGHYNGELVRVPDPGSYTGYADVRDDIDLALSWFVSSGTGYPDGGTITFVPTQGPHAGY